VRVRLQWLDAGDITADQAGKPTFGFSRKPSGYTEWPSPAQPT